MERSTTSLLRYLVLIPLLAPKGLESLVPGYKVFMTFWSMLALAMLLLDSVIRLHGGERISSPHFGLFAYFIVAFAVSAFSVKGIVNGFQELFFYPIAFLYLIELDQAEFREYCVASAYILCVLFLAELLVPASLFAGDYHMTFLGHVQVFSQYGLLAFTLACFIYLKKWVSRIVALLLATLAFISMLAVDADSAHLCIAVFAIVLLVKLVSPSDWRIDFRVVVVLSMVFSGFIVWLTIARRSPLIGTGLDWTFNGRLFVWESAGNLIRDSFLFGYGVENSVIATFWSSGMSYAHNQVVQSLVDGGVVLLIAMVWMLCSVARCVNYISDNKVRSVAVAVLCSLLFVLIFDSFTPYSYVYILLALVSREGLLSKDGSNNEA